MPIVTEPSCSLTRRGFLNLAAAGAATVVLSACTATVNRDGRFVEALQHVPQPLDVAPSLGIDYVSMYAPVVDDGYEIPGIPIKKMRQQFLRQVVVDPTGERPGTLVVDTLTHFLYLVRDNCQAIRYGVGLGRDGFAWQGRAVIQWKRKWPKWTPPEEMISRQPELEKYSVRNGGTAPGLNNPLGARALYIFQNNKDTLYRVHGSPEWWTIGKSVSSGCVRLLNQDIIDLYDRVPSKTLILVINGLGIA